MSSEATRPPRRLFQSQHGGPPIDLSELIEETGSLDPRIYTDPNLHSLEQERVFGRSWLFLAHESQLSKPGDFFTTYMGEDPVIVSRRDDGSIAAFLNQCSHRGMRLCQADTGNAKAFTCTYHGWVFDNAGSLVHVPGEEQLFRCPVDRNKWSAVRVPRIETFHGLIFGNWDPQAPSFRESLGEAAWYLEPSFDGPGGTVVLGMSKWTVNANWKFAAEQFGGDSYHGTFTHASVFRGVLSDALSKLRKPPSEAGKLAVFTEAGRQLRTEQGHGVNIVTDLPLFEALLPLGQAAVDWYRGPRREFLTEKYGEPRGSQIVDGNLNLFPNIGYLGMVRTLRVWQPKGPGRMEVWAWVLCDADAPDEVKEVLRVGNQRTFGAAGLFEQDDTHNWAEIQRVLGGHRARLARFNAEMGTGQTSDPSGRLPGSTDVGTSEFAARGFYKRWATLMSTEVDHGR